MSKNFELLKQIESKLGGSNESTIDSAARPSSKKVGSGDDVVDTWREEILRLVQRIFLSSDSNAPRLVVFCGVDGESGSSAVCADTGRTLAIKSSRSVCLVDANVRSLRLAGLFGFDRKTPFAGESDSVRDQCVQIDGNLWLAGANMLADDRGVLSSGDELKRRLKQLRGAFEYVLIDSPGTNVCGSAAHLGQVADAAVLVIEAHSTRRLSARRAKESLDAAGVRLLGTVLHNRSFPIPERLYRKL